MIQFFAAYFLLLIAAAIITNGFFIVTRGHWETLPDGSREKKGALLKGWYFFWFKEKMEPNVLVYRGDQLQAMFDRIKAHSFIPTTLHMELKGNYSESINNYFIGDSFVTTVEFLQYLPKLRNALGVDFKIGRLHEGLMSVTIYKEEPDYVFSWYIRTVLAGCITCFSSIYGALIFIIFNLTMSKSIIYFSFYSYFGYTPSYIYYPVTLMAFCLSLAWLNTVLWKKV